MTIRLLFPYANDASGAIVDYDNATESALVAQGRAIYVNNPGPVFQPSTPAEQQVYRDFFSATGGGSGLVANGVPAPWATALYARLWASVRSDYGPQPNVARDADYSTLPLTTDNEGILRQTLLNEVLFYGARRERQLARYTEQLSFTGTGGWTPENSLTVAAVWDDQKPTADGLSAQGGTVWRLTAAALTNSALVAQAGQVLDAVPHVFAVKMRATTPITAEIEIAIAGGATLATKSVSVTTAWQWFYVAGTPDGTSSYVYRIAPATKASAAGGAVLVCHPQLHERVGAISAPPEYFSRDADPVDTFWHGADVDGVKYFATTNANTINGTTGVVTPVAGASLESSCRGVDLFPTYSQLMDTRFSTWALADLGSISTVTGPDGKQSGTQYLEGTSGTAHHINSSLIGSSAYGGKWVVLSVYAKRINGTSRSWIRLYLQDIDGSTPYSVYFNIATGAIGTTSAGCYPDVEPIGNGWYRFHFAVRLGTGASNAVMRIYSATADNTPTHTGNPADGILLAIPNATSAISSGSTADRAICMPPVLNPTTGAITVPGTHISYNVAGILGRTDFAVYCSYTPYYRPTRPFKGGQDNVAYTCPTYIRCEAPQDTLTGGSYGDFDTCRTGLTIRPNFQNTTHYGKWAFDLYAGNPNSQFVRKSGTFYSVGQIAIPADTTPNNGNARKVLTCVVPGVTAGSEPATWTSPTPTFTSPPDTTSNLIIDGASRWQCNEDNGIAGNWEPYLGAQLTPPNDVFMAEQRVGWFLTARDYGCWNNGVAHVKQTEANLRNGMSTTLPYRPKTLWLGQFGSNKGVPGAKRPGTTDAELMSTYRAFVRDVHVYHTAPEPAILQAETAN